MKKKLYDYQQLQVDAAIRASKHHKTILVQTPTGGGKTVMFSFIAHRFISATTQDVIIYVHRRELAKQTRQTIFDTFGISAQLISAGMRNVPKARIYIAMVESAKKRMPSNIGLAIIDEAHIASLHKAHTFTDNVTIIAFSATPISANKKQPLKDIYQFLIPGPQINDLIGRGKLCQNITIAPQDVVDRNALAVKGGDFNDKLMGNEFSKAKHVKSTLTYYEKFLLRKKTLIFNCNISHSIEVTRHFKAAGYNIRHLDSENCTDFEREETLRWLKNTPDAILSSVAILTTGFDEPTVEGIIVNRSIMSLSLWLQITGRGGRIFQGKDFFYILDMGANAVNLGDWSDDRDWKDIFENPPTARKTVGVAPCKSCPKCEAIISAQSNQCKYCGYLYPLKNVAEEVMVSEEYKVLTKGIDVSRLITSSKNKGYKDYHSFYEIGNRIIKNAPPHTSQSTLIQTYENEAKKWCESQGKKYNAFHRKIIKDFFDVKFSNLQAHPPSQISQTIQTLTTLQPITNTLPLWLQ
jgi:superfamily II DNA or RNA helicase